MYISNRLYPYPVLRDGSDDFASGKFTVSVNPQISSNGLELNVSYELDNAVLTDLIRDSQATVSCHVECSQTAFRKLYPLQHGANKIDISDSLVAGKVEICVFIIASRHLPMYTNTFHDDYGGQSFSIEAGSPLAIGQQMTVSVQKEAADIENVPSLLKIRKDPIPQGLMRVEMDEHLIIVLLPEEQFIIYESLKANPDMGKTLHSLIVVPVLVHVIAKLQDEASGYQDHIWYSAIDKAIQKKYPFCIESQDFKAKAALEMAQQIIGAPLDSAFQFIASGFTGENGNDED